MSGGVGVTGLVGVASVSCGLGVTGLVGVASVSCGLGVARLGGRVVEVGSTVFDDGAKMANMNLPEPKHFGTF